MVTVFSFGFGGLALGGRGESFPSLFLSPNRIALRLDLATIILKCYYDKMLHDPGRIEF